MPPKKNPEQITRADDFKRVLRLSGYRRRYIAIHIRALIRIYGLRGMKSDGTVGLMYDILFVDNITTHHFEQFQPMWPEHRSSDDTDDPEHEEWWKVFRGFLRDCFTKARVQMNKYFRKSHPEAPRKKNWFPRPAKMETPKPDLGTPPIAIKSVNVPKRKRQVTEASSSKSAGKRRSKRLRMMRDPGTPEDSSAGSEGSEEGDSSPVSMDSEMEYSSSSDEEVSRNAPAAPTSKSPQTPRGRRTIAGPAAPVRQSSRITRRHQTGEQSTIGTPTPGRRRTGEQGNVAGPAGPPRRSPSTPQRYETREQGTTHIPQVEVPGGSTVRSQAASASSSPFPGGHREGTTANVSAATSQTLLQAPVAPPLSPSPRRSPSPSLGCQREEATAGASATTLEGPTPRTIALSPGVRLARLGRNGKQFKQRMPVKRT